MPVFEWYTELQEKNNSQTQMPILGLCDSTIQSAIIQRRKNNFFHDMICVRITKAYCWGNFPFHSHSVRDIDCGQGLGTVDWHNSQCALKKPQRRRQRKHHLKIISCLLCMENVF